MSIPSAGAAGAPSVGGAAGGAAAAGAPKIYFDYLMYEHFLTLISILKII